MEKHKVRAVYDDDLLDLLDLIGIRKALEVGQLKCHECGDPVKLDNLQAIVPLGKNIGVLCSKTICLKTFQLTQGECKQ
ncbi:MAG: hypothetical protein MUO31_11045 [Thermodesulfovibrionales bacterium]|nr:hypothetical protein [Thermodesulfovibrionales bacterium]